MKRTVIAVSMCLGVAPSAAYALDWSLRTSQTESVEANDNTFLRTSPAGTIASFSTLTANAQARTPTSRFDFDGDGSYNKYWGPGTDGVASEFLNYGFRGHYETFGKNNSDREYVEGAWRQQSTALALLNDIGVATQAGGFIDTVRAAGGIDRSLTALDTVSLFAASTRTSYEPSSGGTPFTDTVARGSWRHSLSPITALNVSSEVELLNYDNATNARIQIYRNQLGVDATLSPVLSFRANLGAANVVTEDGANPLAGTGSNGFAASGSSSLLDWIGDAALTYRMVKNTTLSLIANQSIGPSVVGSLFKNDNITASVSHIINDRSSLSFSATGSRSTSTTTTDYVSASATYSYSLTRNLSAQLSYRYRHRFASTGGAAIIDPITGFPTTSGTGDADSNSILLVVSHTYTVLPRGN